MTADDLLARLDKVRPRGKGSWMACCPAHDDREPSLSVRECDDGTILLWCFGGCCVTDISEAVGLELAHLFPEKPADYGHPHKPRHRPRIDARDLIRVLRHALLVVALAAEQLTRGEALSDQDQQILDAAYRHAHQLLLEVEGVL
ncbi:MAG: DNA primase [Gammaproteobacteria bacterium]